MMSRTTILTSLLSIIGGCVTGCATLNPKPPIEEFANKLADQAIIPAVKQGLSQGVEQLTIQSGALARASMLHAVELRALDFYARCPPWPLGDLVVRGIPDLSNNSDRADLGCIFRSEDAVFVARSHQ